MMTMDVASLCLMQMLMQMQRMMSSSVGRQLLQLQNFKAISFLFSRVILNRPPPTSPIPVTITPSLSAHNFFD
jgi:hypothetical protein